MRSHALEVVRLLMHAGRIDVARFETAAAGLLEAHDEAELAAITGSLPAVVSLTPPGRRCAEPVRLGGGYGRLRIDGRWQVARETHITTELGGMTIDLCDAEFDDLHVDLSVYTGWGNITLIVPVGLGVEVVRHRGRVVSQLGPPVPGLPVVRLSARSNIGRIRLLPAGARPRRSWLRRSR